MISSIKCENCEGFGCKECNNIGWLLKDSTNGAIYFVDRVEGKITLGAKKPQESNGQMIKKKLFGEPHDLLWAIKVIREVNRKRV